MCETIYVMWQTDETEGDIAHTVDHHGRLLSLNEDGTAYVVEDAYGDTGAQISAISIADLIVTN